MHLRLVLPLAAVAVLGAAACGSSATCLNDLPATCPTPIPSYANSVSGIINQTCVVGCHTPGGTGQAILLNTYADVYTWRSAVLNQAYSCNMPPAGYPPLTAAERTQLFGWLVCGAPDN